MISKVSVRNFKCLRDVQIEWEQFTTFVGPNASGKSSILQAMDLLCHSLHGDDTGVDNRSIEDELQRGLSRGAKDAVEVAVEGEGKAFRYRTSYNSPHAQRRQWKGNGYGIATTIAEQDWAPWSGDASSLGLLPRSVLLRLEASRLAQPTPGHDATVMAPDGSGLHTALANMALNDPDSWQALQANLRLIIPSIRRLRHTKAPIHEPAALLFDTVGADSVPADQVSEGTLLVLGLLAALHSSSRPNLVLLDDLDRGLHPKAQKELITLLRGLLKSNPGFQLVATTHSPYMLDCMRVNEVRMTFLKEDGATVCAALTSHPKYPKWKDEMTPGEMWSLFGEKWLTEKGVAS
jgi:predicted ATPase